MLLIYSLVHVLVVVVKHCLVVRNGILVNVVGIPCFVTLRVSNHIDVGLVYIFHCSHVSVESQTYCSIDTHNLNSIARLDIVNKILIGAHVDRLGSFSFRNSLWCLLNLDVLLVTKHTQIVLNLKSKMPPTILANLRLDNLASFHELKLFFLALLTLETGLLHLWDCVRSSDNDAFQGDQLVDVLWI